MLDNCSIRDVIALLECLHLHPMMACSVQLCIVQLYNCTFAFS